MPSHIVSISLPVMFTVGADVPEMYKKTFESVIEQDFPANFYSVSKIRKPIIAAVNGHAVCNLNNFTLCNFFNTCTFKPFLPFITKRMILLR